MFFRICVLLAELAHMSYGFRHWCWTGVDIPSCLDRLLANSSNYWRNSKSLIWPIPVRIFSGSCLILSRSRQQEVFAWILTGVRARKEREVARAKLRQRSCICINNRPSAAVLLSIVLRLDRVYSLLIRSHEFLTRGTCQSIDRVFFFVLQNLLLPSLLLLNLLLFKQYVV